MENKTRWHKLLIEITGDFDNKRPLQKFPKISQNFPKSPKFLPRHLGDFGEFCKGLSFYTQKIRDFLMVFDTGFGDWLYRGFLPERIGVLPVRKWCCCPPSHRCRYCRLRFEGACRRFVGCGLSCKGRVCSCICRWLRLRGCRSGRAVLHGC